MSPGRRNKKTVGTVETVKRVNSVTATILALR
jgi:hypothetical protein